MANVVNVFSIDEERLRFRVICAIDALTAGYTTATGEYDINIPIPTSFTNSHEYSSCRIKCDVLTATIQAAATAVNAAWTDTAGNFLRNGNVELQLSAPSSQTSLTTVNAAVGNPGAFNEPVEETSGFKQIVPIQFVAIGGAAAGWNPAVAASGGWVNVGEGHPIICANPFGSRLRLRLVDVFSRRGIFLSNSGAGPGPPLADIGKYTLQFEIEMVENK